MNKLIILISLLIACYSKSFSHDSLKINTLIKEIDNLKICSNSLDSSFIEISKFCQEYKISNEYFKSILSTQTTIFSAIVGCLLTFVGFLSFFSVKHKINQLRLLYKKEINKFEEKYSRFKDDIKNVKFTSYLGAANSYVGAKTVSLEAKEKSYGSLWSLAASYNFYNASLYIDDENKKDRNVKLSILHLKEACDILKGISMNQLSNAVIKNFRSYISYTEEYIGNLHSIPEQDIINLLAEYRILFNSKFQIEK